MHRTHCINLSNFYFYLFVWSNQNNITHLSKPEISCKVQEISENLSNPNPTTTTTTSVGPSGWSFQLVCLADPSSWYVMHVLQIADVSIFHLQILHDANCMCCKLSSCQKLPKVLKSSQKFSKVLKSSQKFSKLIKSYQKLSKVIKSCQKLPKVAKNLPKRDYWKCHQSQKITE